MPAFSATEISMMRRGISGPPSLVLVLDAIAGSEDPRDRAEADAKEQKRHRDAYAKVHVGGFKEAPAEAADQIHDRIEQRDGLPAGWQHVNRIERAAEEGERRDDQQRHHLQLLETVGPDAENEAE